MADKPRETSSHIPLENVYSGGDARNAHLGAPGEYPYTRGIHAEMYRKRLWTMRQYAGTGTARETNTRFKYLLANGQTGLSTAFDLPTQNGYDADHPNAEGEVGKVGVSISSLADMEELFDGIPLGDVSTSMTINAPAAILLAMYVVAAEKRGVPLAQLSGTTQNDVLKEYVARGTYIFPPRHALRLAAELIAYSARELPKWNPISASGYHMRDAGSTAVQEMAFAVSNAIAYVDATRAWGVAVDTFAPRISWIFNTHNHFFEEVAKYRALRRLWARILRERFGARDPRSWQLRTHSQTGGATLTLQQPENNVVRAAYQAMAAVLGGVQSLALSCRDEAISIPTEESQEIALRTQQILAHETGVADVADPLGGSYYVEALTDELEKRAVALIDEIDAMGGAVAAIENGFMQRAIDDEAYRAQCEIESGARVVVGVNAFQRLEQSRLARFPLDPAAEAAQIEKLHTLRARRDNDAVSGALADVRTATERGDAQIPPIIAAVRAYATTGEIVDAIAAVWGRYRP